MAKQTTARTLEIAEATQATGYREIAAVLYARIRDGRYSLGVKIPTEAELCVEFGAARLTIRRALAVLIDAKAIEPRQGAGTFVSAKFKAPPPNMEIKLASPSRGTWRDGDMFKYLGASKIRLNKADQDFFGTDSKSTEQFQYLRLRRGVPVDVSTFYYADWVLKLITDRSEGVMLHLHPYLQERGIVAVHSREKYGAVAADEKFAKLLDVPVGAPLMRSNSFNWDSTGKAIWRGTWLHRADNYELELDVKIDRTKL